MSHGRLRVIPPNKESHNNTLQRYGVVKFKATKSMGVEIKKNHTL